MDRQAMDIEKDMLKGNIARVCVSNDPEELDRMRQAAHRRIDLIADLRIQQLQANTDEPGK